MIESLQSLENQKIADDESWAFIQSEFCSQLYSCQLSFRILALAWTLVECWCCNMYFHIQHKQNLFCIHIYCSELRLADACKGIMHKYISCTEYIQSRHFSWRYGTNMLSLTHVYWVHVRGRYLLLRFSIWEILMFNQISLLNVLYGFGEFLITLPMITLRWMPFAYSQEEHRIFSLLYFTRLPYIKNVSTFCFHASK